MGIDANSDIEYGYRVDPTVPVVKFGVNKPVYMPAELLDVMPGQVLRRKTTADETAKMILFSCRSPWANAVSITTVGRDVLGLDGNPKLVSRVSPRMKPWPNH